MVHGDIGSTLLKGSSRVTASAQQRVDNLIGLRDGTSRMIDKTSLQSIPFGEVTVAFFDGERAHIHALDAVNAFQKLGFGFAAGTVLPHRQVVFRPEPRPKFLSPPSVGAFRYGENYGDHDEENNRADADNYRRIRHVEVHSGSPFL